MKQKEPASHLPNSRREFLGGAALTVIGLSLPVPVPAASSETTATPSTLGFHDLQREPDSVMVQTATDDFRLNRTGGRWTNGQVLVSVTDLPGALGVQMSAPAVPIKRLHLRWRARIDDTRLILGDAWERGYGDLEWRGLVPDRVMPWYFATYNGSLTHSYGVRTGARAFCFWQVDPEGISLWADVRSGGAGVQLGERVLDVCEINCRAGRAGESAFAAVHAFCRQMCSNPRLPPQPVYGSNDWYWAYGKNSAETVLAAARHIVELSPASANRPFAVIDDGWQPERGKDKTGVGTWDRGNEKFPDMSGLAAEIRRAAARPGIWIRPLQATADAHDSWRLPRDRAILDPTVPEVRQKSGRRYRSTAAMGVRADQARLHYVRHLGQVGLSDGRCADEGRLDVRLRARAHHGRGD